MTEPIKIFIAYAREDAPYLKEMRKHLRILERRETIDIWYDGEIVAGAKFNEVIERELERADIFLLLLSADFINSDYAYGKEMRQALERHEKGEATVIPIIVRACNWDMTPLAELQAPVSGKPLGSVQGAVRDQLYAEIVRAVDKAVEERRAEKDKLRRYFDDEKAWKNALQLHSINGYNRYLEQHPKGRHTAAARNAIADIQRKQQAEKEATERKAWQQAQQLHTIASYNDYLQKYPTGRFMKEAQRAIRKLAKGVSAGEKQRNYRRLLLVALALLMLGVTTWQVATWERMTNSTSERLVEANPIEETQTTSDDDSSIVEDAPSTENEEQAAPPPLELSYRFGKNLIKSKIEGGKPPYTVRLLKNDIEKYQSSYSSYGEYDITITTAFRADAGDYTLEVVDSEGQKATKMVSIAPLKTSDEEVKNNKVILPEMVKVKGGTFTMGCKEGRDKDCDNDEKPAHQVTLDDFYIGKYEVTVGEYLAFADAVRKHYPQWLEAGNEYHIETGSNAYYKNKGYSRTATKLPIVGVRWNNAVAYCEWLSEKTSETYRLPTEAEWEYVARGGNQQHGFQYAGSDNLDAVAWYGDNSGSQTHPVGSKSGLTIGDAAVFDMSGNVYEWCQDQWHSDYSNAPKDGSAWVDRNNSGSSRVLRGGSWFYYRGSCRASNRDVNLPRYRDSYIGFRVVRAY